MGIASTVKIVILAVHTRQVADGRVDPEAEVPLANWEVHLLPGTDGGGTPAPWRPCARRAR